MNDCNVTGVVGAHTATWLVSSVTPPFLARSAPFERAPVVNVILVSANELPTKAVPVPSVSELPTCQNTLQFEPPFMTTTLDALAVVSVDPT